MNEKEDFTIKEELKLSPNTGMFILDDERPYNELSEFNYEAMEMARDRYYQNDCLGWKKEDWQTDLYIATLVETQSSTLVLLVGSKENGYIRNAHKQLNEDYTSLCNNKSEPKHIVKGCVYWPGRIGFAEVFFCSRGFLPKEMSGLRLHLHFKEIYVSQRRMNGLFPVGGKYKRLSPQ